MLSLKGNEIMVAYHLLFIAFCFVVRAFAYCLMPIAYCLMPFVFCPGKEAALVIIVVLFTIPGWVCVLPRDSLLPHTNGDLLLC